MIKGLTVCAVAMLTASGLAAQQTTSWNWNERLESGRTVYLHNINGSVTIEAGSGRDVKVTAEKSWRRGNPDDVRIEARRAQNGDIVICALWGAESSCGPDGYSSNRGQRNNTRNNDVSVRFTVQVPGDAKVVSGTVNGAVRIEGTTGDIRANTVNGSVSAHSNGGRVEARSVNGNISVRTNPRSSADVQYTTVNGSITLELPENASAELDLSTVNGSVSTEFPVTVQGRLSPRRIRASLGSGGALIKASTVNGSVKLRKY